MQRLSIEPRPDWQATVESQGLTYHTVDGEPVWNESACYQFSADEIDQLEAAANELHRMCLEAVEHVIADDLLGLVGIPGPFQALIKDSWRRKDPSVYGRFDLLYDGTGAPKLLEYNADTPTALLEAAVVQWYWMQDRFPKLDQFNSIHERLIEMWKSLVLSDVVAFTSMDDEEDAMTATYLRDTAHQAGIATSYLPISEVGWNPRFRAFMDAADRPMLSCFKLYPWEWLFEDAFGEHLSEATTRWIEPPWKAVLSSKAILPVLWSMFPDSEYLVEASFDPIGGKAVRKPLRSREGANLQFLSGTHVESQTPGPYGGPYVYQRRIPASPIGDRFPVLGCWIVGSKACGMGVREDQSPITTNRSAFVPHMFEP